MTMGIFTGTNSMLYKHSDVMVLLVNLLSRCHHNSKIYVISISSDYTAQNWYVQVHLSVSIVFVSVF